MDGGGHVNLAWILTPLERESHYLSDLSLYQASQFIWWIMVFFDVPLASLFGDVELDEEELLRGCRVSETWEWLGEVEQGRSFSGYFMLVYSLPVLRLFCSAMSRCCWTSTKCWTAKYTNLYWASVWTIPDLCPRTTWMLRWMSISHESPFFLIWSMIWSITMKVPVLPIPALNYIKKILLVRRQVKKTLIDDVSPAMNYNGSRRLDLVLFQIYFLKEIEDTSWVRRYSMVRPCREVKLEEDSNLICLGISDLKFT